MKRLPHAVSDLSSRYLKAQKIERLLNLSNYPKPIRLLEVGTDSGGIAHYFAAQGNDQYEVMALDVVDVRYIRTGYAFHLVSDTTLPFSKNSFDVVLSNHVIEHVGERPKQLAHLREIHRVLAPCGVGYLAVPNRWMLIEPHYRLPFLSWFPQPMRTLYLQLMRKSQPYDCEPLTLRSLNRLLTEAGFSCEHLELEALQTLVEFEGNRGFHRILAKRAPASLMKILRPFIPTFICRLDPQK
ncbi:MAG: class I SAM-dependent methyltransferase [Deltaproteobacteria bacterium]|nr:class I SAM-dependent methyltransferase [Deltaproteobacteria bacterium]